ncbi:otopetrin-3 isoform X1 [Fopius arisanus]|uniref:Otopetrin-3 isoform X1 n=1 Tax=Fopius arisanus TaxID=64838 RepID=A0A9R1U0X8_9HYME|nr:PREDICTED: otopetrin-3-like isoform X1 [Fopius arisanus]
MASDVTGTFESAEPMIGSSSPVGESHAPTTNFTCIDLEGRDNFHPSHHCTRTPSLRRQSIALNAIINHRRALIGALIAGVGSNLSLPSCVNQDQEVSRGSNSSIVAVGQHVQGRNSNGDSPGHRGCKHHSNFLQLTPVNTSSCPLTSLDPPKATPGNNHHPPPSSRSHQKNRAELISTVSTLYAKLLVVIGVTVPVTASIGQPVPVALDQGFYLYLYLVSGGFVITMYTILLRDKAVNKLLVENDKRDGVFLHDEYGTKRRSSQHRQQYGSFCLRLGAIGFGAGSLVFTGLQIGAEIASAVPFRAITPSARLLLVTAQMHFIFLNSKDLELTKHGPLAKLGLMHMIATNICEWLQALVEETRHEISHLESKPNTNDGLLRNLLRDASPFLFPCTIEFSLICAVILFEMWKRVDRLSVTKSNSPTRSVHHLSIDCSNAHRGLFGGILIIAATVLSLIMFFVLKDAKPKMAIQQVTALETTILIAGAIAAVSGALKLRRLEWKKTKLPHLDSTLLAAAQAGVYLHCMFGAVGGVLTMGPTWGLSLAADFIALVQSTSQTLLIKIAWRRQSSSNAKPGKELITFLIVMNIALWIVNSFEKSRAAVRPEHLEFFGVWAWTIITHVSMPLAIFFRFHSAICLFEVWKSCYKYRPPNFFHQFRSPNEKT